MHMEEGGREQDCKTGKKFLGQGVSSSHVTRSSAVRLGSSWPGWLGTAGDRWGPLGTAGDRWGSLGTAGDAGDESFVTEFTYGKFIN